MPRLLPALVYDGRAKRFQSRILAAYFSPIPRPERFLMALALRSARSAFRANAFLTERAEPSVVFVAEAKK
jgi:hypothetical protein